MLLFNPPASQAVQQVNWKDLTTSLTLSSQAISSLQDGASCRYRALLLHHRGLLTCLSLHPWNTSWKQTVSLLTLYSKSLLPCLAPIRCNINVSWINKLINGWSLDSFTVASIQYYGRRYASTEACVDSVNNHNRLVIIICELYTWIHI